MKESLRIQIQRSYDKKWERLRKILGNMVKVPDFKELMEDAVQKRPM